METVTCIHYTEKANWQLRQPDLVNGEQKPKNCLWASPIDSEFGWIHYVSEKWVFQNSCEIYPREMEYSVELEIRKDTLITIENEQDVENLPLDEIKDRWGYPIRIINWQKIREAGYLGVWVKLSAIRNIPEFFRSWDVESIVVFNKSAVVDAKPVQHSNYNEVYQTLSQDNWS